MAPIILSTAYLPSTNWFYYLLNYPHIVIEAHENFAKQTLRNRCEILSANGKLSLSIPLHKLAAKEKITTKRISYSENWQLKHWRAIESAYKNSPYFDFFESDFKKFYTDQFEFLFDYNLKLIELICHLLREKISFKLSHEFIKDGFSLDLRNTIHRNEYHPLQLRKYNQVFSSKFDFHPNLSIIDLLFNKALETKSYLALDN